MKLVEGLLLGQRVRLGRMVADFELTISFEGFDAQHNRVALVHCTKPGLLSDAQFSTLQRVWQARTPDKSFYDTFLDSNVLVVLETVRSNTVATRAAMLEHPFVRSTNDVTSGTPTSEELVPTNPFGVSLTHESATPMGDTTRAESAISVLTGEFLAVDEPSSKAPIAGQTHSENRTVFEPTEPLPLVDATEKHFAQSSSPQAFTASERTEVIARVRPSRKRNVGPILAASALAVGLVVLAYIFR